jgi:hypothetical protein
LGIAQHQTDVPGYGLVSFLMGDAHPTGLLNVLTTKAQPPSFILESRDGVDEASHSRVSSNMGNNAIPRSPGFPPSRE